MTSSFGVRRARGTDSSRIGILAPYRIVLSALCLVLLGAGTGAAEGRIYEYVDRQGVSHYSDSLSSVPDAYRDQVREWSGELEPGGRLGTADLRGRVEMPEPVAAWLDLADLDLAPGDQNNLALSRLAFVPLLLFSFFLLVALLLSAGILKLACRLAGEAPPGMGRACCILLAQMLAGILVGAAVGGGSAWLGIGESVPILASVAVGGASTLLSWAANAGILTAATGYGFLTCLWVGLLNILLIAVIVGAPLAVIALSLLLIA